MSHFIGERPGFTDHAAGTVRFEIDLELWSESGRPKHTDLTEQGGFLAEFIVNALKKFDVGNDVAVHRLRYFGAKGSDVASDLEIGNAPPG